MTFIFDYKSRASEKKKRIGWAGGGGAVGAKGTSLTAWNE